MPEQLAVEVESLVQRFSNYLRAMQKSPRTAEEYTKSIRAWWSWWQKPLEAFDTKAWDEFLYHETERGVKGVTIRMRQSALRKFYKFLRRQGIVKHNPSEDAESVGVIKRKPEFLSEQQINLMFQAASPSPRDTAMLELLYSCGLRNTELRDLPHENVTSSHIRVIGKGRKERLIGITPKVWESYQNHSKASRIEFYAFTGKRGSRTSMMTVQRTVRRLAQSAGISQLVKPHTLRHSIATHLAMRKTNPIAIQHFLGHNSIETTMIYVHMAEVILSESILSNHPRS